MVVKNNIKNFLENYLKNLNNSILKSDIQNIERAAMEIKKVSEKKNTIYVCGNGGSAAISNHYVCDYLKFLRQHSKLRPKVISLSSTIETITAIGNDFNYDQIFKYQAESLFEKNDLLIIISSSGKGFIFTPTLSSIALILLKPLSTVPPLRNANTLIFLRLVIIIYEFL